MRTYEEALSSIAYNSAAVRLGKYLSGSNLAVGLGQETIALTLYAAYPEIDLDKIKLDVASNESSYYDLLQKQEVTRHVDKNGTLNINIG